VVFQRCSHQCHHAIIACWIQLCFCSTAKETNKSQLKDGFKIVTTNKLERCQAPAERTNGHVHLPDCSPCLFVGAHRFLTVF